VFAALCLLLSAGNSLARGCRLGLAMLVLLSSQGRLRSASWEARGLGNLAAKMLQFFGQLLQYHCSLSFCRPSIAELAVTPDVLLLDKPVHQTLYPGEYPSISANRSFVQDDFV
jgi:hypothetical protein